MATMQGLILLHVVVVAAAAAVLVSTASGASYTVGEPGGSWDTQTNHTAWASSITFRLGDQLVFKYSPAEHDMVEVTKAGYSSCSPFSPVSAHRSGEDTVKLDGPGRRYFICSVRGHCAAGMKLQVRVASADCPAGAPASINITNGTPGTNGSPGGVHICSGGPPTVISTPGIIDISPSSGGAAVSAVLVAMAATALLLVLL